MRNALIEMQSVITNLQVALSEARPLESFCLLPLLSQACALHGDLTVFNAAREEEARA